MLGSAHLIRPRQSPDLPVESAASAFLFHSSQAFTRLTLTKAQTSVWFSDDQIDPTAPQVNLRRSHLPR
jgi:hypothetical protein